MALLPFISSYLIAPLTTLSTGAWPSANLILYVPIAVPESFTVLRVWWVNGNVASDNCNLGFYDQTGSKLWETGSTAMSGTSQAQFVNIADQAHVAGLYYMAFQQSGTTGTFPRQNPSSAPLFTIAHGVLQEQAGSFALPSTATFAPTAYGYLPAFGLDLRGAP